MFFINKYIDDPPRIGYFILKDYILLNGKTKGSPRDYQSLRLPFSFLEANMAQQLDTNPTGKSDYRTTIEVADGETSEWYIIASETKFVAVELETAGTASIEATLDIKGAIAEPPTAIGVPWTAGVTTGNVQDVAVGGTAIRLVSAAGPAKMYVNASKA